MTENTFELVIDSMAQGGRGVGRHHNRPVFVPYTIPGERVLARITQRKGDATYAEGVKLMDSSADRVYPQCPHFGPGRCGRCQWQHIGYEAQLLLKQDLLADQLARLGGFEDADVHPVIASPQQWGYNYHATFSVTAEETLGFPGAEEGSVVPIEDCHVLHPDLLALYQSLDLELTGIKRVKLQMGNAGDGAAPMLILLLAEETTPSLETDLPASVNLLLPDNEPLNLVGDSHCRYKLNGRTFRVTAGSAWRANVSQIPNLVGVVMDMLGDSAAVLDLYAGVGVFSAFAAERARLVTLVESYPPAVTDADDNLADFEHVDVYEGGVEAVLPELDTSYDAVIVDPPARLSSEAMAELLRLNIPRLIYVSGDPAALAQDARKLVKGGYRLAHVQPLDSAPQTYYLDAAALFVR